MKTGSLRNPIDNRDIFVSQVQSPVALPNKYVTDISMLPVLNQGTHGACVGHAVAIVLQYFDYLENKKVTPISPRYIYGLAKTMDGIPDVDGTYPRVAAKITTDFGSATTKTVPNDISLTKTAYNAILNRKEADKDAIPHKTKGYAFVANNTESIKQAIFQNKLVTVSVPVGNWNNAFVKPPKDNSNLHYIVLYGFETSGGNTIFYFRNSWGDKWGDKGTGYLTSKDYEGRCFDAMTYLDLPNEVLQEARNKWKYFKDSEVIGLNWKLVDKLDEAREIAGVPFKITSGFRSKEQNKKAGGVEDSAHLSGYAVDIACTSDINRYKIQTALLKVGFNRLGIGETFIHADIDPNKPANVIWHYYKPSVTRSMNTMLDGKKTYIGIAMLLIGAFGIGGIVTETDASQIIDAVVTIVGACVAIYGRYKATK